ncbi:MAG: ABC transporter substrate-binding protein [Armatimonadota bacterium]|nr:ABC transporter substrate-binding protein [Armatimonadota bacterium]MDR7568150.1 ABC transporter substrate-binding protein [Armatimonadota bacterium]
MRRRGALVMLVVVLLWTGVTAEHAAIHAQARIPVRLAYQINIFGGLAIVALERDLFTRRGLEVRGTGVAGGIEARSGLFTGDFNAVTMAKTPFLTTVAAGPAVAVAMTLYGGNMNAVVVRRDSPIRQLGDLRGRKVASQVGTGSDLAFKDFVLPSVGLRESDVQVVNARYTDHVGMLQAGLVDAFVGVEPFITLAEGMGIGRILVEHTRFDPNPSFLVLNEEWFQRNPEGVRRLVEAWVDAYELWLRNRRDFAAALQGFYSARGTPLNLDVAMRLTEKMDVYPGVLGGLRDYLGQETEALFRRGQIRARIDWNRALRTELVTQVLRERGLLQTRRITYTVRR